MIFFIYLVYRRKVHFAALLIYNGFRNVDFESIFILKTFGGEHAKKLIEAIQEKAPKVKHFLNVS
jgi:hypothetical protein